MSRRSFTRAALAAAVLTLPGALPAAAQGEWRPTRPIEFVVTSGAGGGTDVFARTVQGAITKHNLVPTSIIVTNKGAGSGAEGFVYARGAQGDAHKVVFATNNTWLLPMVSRVAFKAEDFRPVAILAFDEFMLWVKYDSPHRTAADFLAAARSANPPLKMGGSQPKDTDQTLTSLIQRAANVRFTYVPFRGGGEAGTQLAGGHIDANTNNPSESIGGWRGSQVRPVCVFRREPMARGELVTQTQGWHDIPTCSSQGIPIEEFSMPRTTFLPPGTTPAQQAYWVDVMRRVVETPEWKDYITRTSQSTRFTTGDAFSEHIRKDVEASREIFQAEGWLVN
ncbi:Bug family tripartite tricarboxylate transporter substrate binding protein [Elioraea rosea]|uniref:Bug family tripartite tricarboxylate transporter substrate binding protein n=1 Tax=Elioraea rosea TaxID=2492390 RepID=UPI0011830259|nr:tripartite tricarboxylate transporter substrate-binding protein [Elioraea rosea]